MTETDLITAGGSSENSELPNTVTSDSHSRGSRRVGDDARRGNRPDGDVASGDRAASLSSMVLPELRALAKQIGVEGASGMRKGELVAAIRERRGELQVQRPCADAAAETKAADAAPTANAPETAPADTATPDTATPDAGSEQPTQQRRERRGAARGAGAPAGDQNKQDADQETQGRGRRRSRRQAGHQARGHQA